MKKTNYPLKASPLGVKIISILLIVYSSIHIIVSTIALLLLIFRIPLDPLKEGNNVVLGILTLGGITIFGVIIFIISGGILMYIAYNLLKGKNWARITIIVLASIWIVTGIFSIDAENYILGVILLIIEILIVGYLVFSKKVKTFFKYN